jgi:hypothetical protein
MCQNLVYRTTSIKPRSISAFTLPEVLVASSLGLIVLLGVGLLSFYSSRSFVAMANYAELDQHSQLALDKLSREIRQARQLTDYTATSLTFQDVDRNSVQFIYDPTSRRLVRVSGGQTNTYLTDCDSLQFSKYQKTPISNSFDAYQPAFVSDTKVIQVTWICSRTILGAKANSESVQSAKVALRNSN